MSRDTNTSNEVLQSDQPKVLILCFPSSLASVSCCEGDGAGSSGLSPGASAMCPPTGAGVDPHPVPVCGAGGLWHGLPGTEEVHPQGLGSPVRDCFRKHKKSLKLFCVLSC